MVVSSDVLEKAKKAGAIAAEARRYAESLVVPGARLLDVAEKVEAFIRRQGALPAFPVNVSLNSIAAHYTPVKGEATVFQDTDIVKVDVGVHVDGFIGDTAVTICLDAGYTDLKKAAEKALAEAVKLARPGIKTSDIGTAIQQAIESFGFKPVSNLTGHGVNRYVVHDEPTIPNVKSGASAVLQEDQMIAIEPFATDGAGSIREGNVCTIYGFAEKKGVRLPTAKRILDLSEKTFQKLPFATRWIQGIDGVLLDTSIRQLLLAGAIEAYPILRETGDGMVAQAEHTIIVSDKPIITTQ